MSAEPDVGETATSEGSRDGESLALRLINVEKTYGAGPTRVIALHGVNLEVRAGEFVVLLGPSGSGKTTLLNIIGGIDQPSAGAIEVNGEDAGRLNRKLRTRYRRDHVGFVFQFFNLVPTLTALENVELLAELTGPDARSRSRAALERVGVGAVADRFPAQLSGGQQQRVAIARAIVKNSPLLLCDEPTGSLDLVTGRQVLAALSDLARNGRQTVIVVTHNSEIARMADRVLWLHSGAISKSETNENPVEASELDW
ncbi:putative ABC transporter ATP-binding protein [Mycobacterium simulans]|uniref:ABC transporter ATP-binding protein n=1 Tax=Mycobacterium simulans TaxID=627089 RepID=UPI00174A56F6|nr:ABC transporter ATP-binding protein [Mycobacterium simulans]SON60296.1 putative ABC transporter ATP-binding protein [Mycobacterium simulans]